MPAEYAWQKPYREAMLELDTVKLRQLIAAAQEAIAARLEEIGNDETVSMEERVTLGDAQQNLRVLLRTSNRSEPRNTA